MIWYYENVDSNPEILKQINALTGKYYVDNNGKLFTEDFCMRLKAFETMKTAYITFDKNPRENRIVYLANGLKVRFSQIGPERTYMGYPYYYPIIDGKECKIKGRTFKVEAVPNHDVLSNDVVFDIKKMVEVKE